MYCATRETNGAIASLNGNLRGVSQSFYSAADTVTNVLRRLLI